MAKKVRASQVGRLPGSKRLDVNIALGTHLSVAACRLAICPTPAQGVSGTEQKNPSGKGTVSCGVSTGRGVCSHLLQTDAQGLGLEAATRFDSPVARTRSPGASHVLPVTPRGRKRGSPEGWPAVLGCGESLWDFVLQPPREARGVIE